MALAGTVQDKNYPPMTAQLKQLRDKIDAIDSELLKLVSARADIAREIGEIKNGTAYRPEREAQVLARMRELNPGPLENEQVGRLFTEIMSLCRSMEEPLTIAYLGPRGTFSEEAALKRFGSVVTSLPCNSIDDVFRKVEAGKADYGVVPVENSTEGAVGRSLDLLLQTRLKVCGEVALAIHQLLLAHHADLARIRRIYSHPQSFSQCHEWLNANLPHLPASARINAASNADAARLAAEDESAAAVAGKKAGEVYGLTVCAENIEDDPNNTTRFLIIGEQEVAPSGRDKTSLVTSVRNRPGAIHELLAPFAHHGVSMTRLESRPSRAGLWEYVFFVDVEGHQQEPKVSQALHELVGKAAFLKVLGSYPAA
ncbi:chorismate mutase /prephenate dehydratase [Nitrosospira multiformis]|jgi:chorismate mutase/prephenate dehydratase|uniref:Bifunctional chorismate mutase/prephenate dehydratase n=2 Tax=Nitrosospira multiformis TaxID=1231 RepID=A0A2T5I7P5_9PROT|nr:chorismate mutase /prephenate dehydratase [Nitrosospira multiformis]